MLKRIYVHNYRCLVNFEFAPEPVSLILGPNGSGKSSLFDLLNKLQLFLDGEGKVTELFLGEDLTVWQTSSIQTFELELEGNGGVYRYRLEIEHGREPGYVKVLKELLFYDGRPLFQFQEGVVQLNRDDFSEGPKYSYDWTQSGMAVLEKRHDNKRLSWFKDRVQRFLIVRINPNLMSAESPGENERPAITMENYASWYRYLVGVYFGKVIELTTELRQVLQDFDSFRFRKAGDMHRVMEALFSSKSKSPGFHSYRFDRLSDGQKALVALYTLLHCGLGADESEGSSLCIDEPENFLALPEIEPWLQSLHDRCVDAGQQALIISHHPNIINYFAGSAGYWFDRDGEGPVRVKRISDEADTGLPIAELIQRGWISG
jgi:energy-coupling factor transporter ATP-binding protein EcfA2